MTENVSKRKFIAQIKDLFVWNLIRERVSVIFFTEKICIN